MDQTTTPANPGAAQATSGATDQPLRQRRARRSSDLSYKFQRLREKIRQAIAGGELTGKLPGERVLAKRFHCNAKTLSKALTDLAAEGVLDRHIGRGTYVKGAAPAQPTHGPWLILCNPGQTNSAVVQHLLRMNPEAKVVVGEPSSRPSFVTQFTGVVDFTGNAPEAFLRDVVVRNIPAVVVGHEPRTYSIHAVLVDRLLGAGNIGRDLLMAGHRRFAVVE
ncbi:MAG: GntR family transcriptional regulator, partial [Tepidisphaeraceae bacterium]